MSMRGRQAYWKYSSIYAVQGRKRRGNAKSKERQAAGHLPLPITIFVACRNLMAERLAEG